MAAGAGRRVDSDAEAARAHPWAVDDAPDSYVDAQLKGIFGIEIPIQRIEGNGRPVRTVRTPTVLVS